MKALFVAVVVLGSVGRAALADPDPAEPLYQCHKVSADTKISVSFQPDVSLRDLSAWVIGFTCKNIIFSSDVAKHANKVTIISPNKMTPKQALQLFVDSVEATGLVVVQKNDSIIIKLGPNMPKNCPDIATNNPLPQREPPAVPAQPDPVISDAELDAGIKKIDDTHVTITRGLVDKLLENPMAFATGARVVPAIKNGKPGGFKLYAIRPSSAFARIGFANGDTLESINGFELTSADKALEVYTKIRDATSIELSITRAGKPVTLRISIR
jgi:type II secretory pathway component PulC